jgi:membrane protein DedA with SNARE-associated domain
MIVICRAVPVLAEASVLFAGVTRMPFRRFLLLAGLSNLGIAVTYSAVGAYALEAESFLLAFAGAIILPGIAMLVAHLRN